MNPRYGTPISMICECALEHTWRVPGFEDEFGTTTLADTSERPTCPQCGQEAVEIR